MISSLQVRIIVLRLRKRKDNQNGRTCLLPSASLCCAGLNALLSPPRTRAVAPSVGNGPLPRPPFQAGWSCGELAVRFTEAYAQLTGSGRYTQVRFCGSCGWFCVV